MRSLLQAESLPSGKMSKGSRSCSRYVSKPHHTLNQFSRRVVGSAFPVCELLFNLSAEVTQRSECLPMLP